MPPTARDAFLIPVTIAEIGVPWFGLRVAGLAREETPDDPALAARIAEQERALRGLLEGSAEMVATVESWLARSGIEAPPRPADFQGYLDWANAVAEGLTAALRPEQPEGALAMLGRCAGELIQSAMVLAGVLHLRAVADLEVLKSYDAGAVARFTEWTTKIAAAVSFPSLPETVRPHAAAMAQIAQAVAMRPPELGPAQAMQLYRAGADRLGGLVAAVRDQLPD